MLTVVWPPLEKWKKYIYIYIFIYTFVEREDTQTDFFFFLGISFILSTANVPGTSVFELF